MEIKRILEKLEQKMLKQSKIMLKTLTENKLHTGKKKKNKECGNKGKAACVKT